MPSLTDLLTGSGMAGGMDGDRGLRGLSSVTVPVVGVSTGAGLAALAVWAGFGAAAAGTGFADVADGAGLAGAAVLVCAIALGAAAVFGLAAGFGAALDTVFLGAGDGVAALLGSAGLFGLAAVRLAVVRFAVVDLVRVAGFGVVTVGCADLLGRPARDRFASTAARPNTCATLSCVCSIYPANRKPAADSLRGAIT